MEERRKPSWAKAVVAVFSALIFVVGLAGAPDDLQIWYGWLQRGIPWWVLIGASVILPSLVWAPEIASRVRRLRRKSNLRDKPIWQSPNLEAPTLGDVLQEQIDALPSEREMLDNAIAEGDQLKRDFESQRIALEQHQGEIQRLRTELRQWQEFVWYGEYLTSFPPLGESDYSVMVSRLGELREHVKDLFAASRGLWTAITGWSELRADYESPLYWPARLINEFVFRSFENAIQGFEQLLENEPQKDPRPYLLMVYKKHGQVALWIRHLLKESTKHQGLQPRFAHWEEMKKSFEKALKEKCGAPQLRELRLGIEAHDKKVRQTMPDELLFMRLVPRIEAPPDPEAEQGRP